MITLSLKILDSRSWTFLSMSKFIILTLPLNKESFHMFNKNIFSLMRKDSFLINVARGKIINEEHLVQALKEKKIAGAGLDVFEFEPRINKKLLELTNVVMMPHAGSATKKTRTAMADLAIDNLEEFFNTGKCKNKVN